MRRLARDVAYEIVVVDNAPEPATRELVTNFAADGTLDRSFLSPENILCAKGSTDAARPASTSATHLLLLNSEISVLNGGGAGTSLPFTSPVPPPSRPRTGSGAGMGDAS